jgi:hypothetical protein
VFSSKSLLEETVGRARLLVSLLASFVLLPAASLPASAQDNLKLALGQRGNWDTAIAELGQQAGIFKKHGLTLDILWTQGAGESQQAVLASSVDIGLAGTLAAFGAYQKGAPLRIIAAEATGAADFWYVRADSPIHSIEDLDGKTNRVLDDGRLHPHAGAGVPQAGRRRGQAGGNRRAGADVHAGDVGTGRRRLVGAAIRA